MERKQHFICFTVGLLSVLSPFWLSQPAFASGKPSYDSKMQLGQSLQFNGNLEQAIKAYKYAASLKPTAFDPHFALVNVYVQLQDFAAAAEECREALKIKANNRDLHLLLGNLDRTMSTTASDPAEQKRLLTEAIKELEEADKCGANQPLVHSTLSVLFIQNGDFDKALEHVNIALDKKDNQPDAHLIKGVLKFKKGDKVEALKELNIAIEQKGKNAEARNTKADILLADGKVDEALSEYKLALADDKKYSQAMIGIANIYVQKQKWDEALTWFEKAQDCKPGDANTLYSLGICLEKLGKTDLAVAKFNEGIMVDNNPNTQAQIRSHILDLTRNSLFSVPGLVTPGGTPIGPGAPGSGLFLPDSSFLAQPLKDLIKVNSAGAKEEKQPEKKDKAR